MLLVCIIFAQVVASLGLQRPLAPQNKHDYEERQHDYEQRNQDGRDDEVHEALGLARAHEGHNRLAAHLLEVLSVDRDAHKDLLAVVVVWVAGDARRDAHHEGAVDIQAHAVSEFLEVALDGLDHVVGAARNR